jgi:hypothetical protein
MSSEKRFMALEDLREGSPTLEQQPARQRIGRKELPENPADPEVFFDNGFRYALGEPLDASNYLLPHGFHGYCPRCD